MADGARSTMDFFAAQAAAKRRTGVLVVLFALAWISTVLLADLGIGLALSFTERPIHRGYDAITAPAEFDPGAAPWARFADLLLPVAAGVSAILLLGTAWHALRLGRDGGDAVARLLGGVPVDRNTVDPDERRAVNVVEEMAIAAAIPVPRLYVLPDETSINAFAAGSAPEEAVVGLTRGAITGLDRDELQGVIAHELSHVLHSDVRLNMRLIALVGGLTVLTLLGRIVLRVMSEGPRVRVRSRGKGNGVAIVFLVGLVLLVAGAIGSFFARLIRLAVSRQREFLADAAAVQFTRNPAGLAGALAKLQVQGSALESVHAPQLAHMFFANGLGGATAGFLSTHPPLEERIERLRAGPLAALARAPAQARSVAPSPPPRARPPGAPPFAGGPLGAAALPLAAAAAAASIGRPAAEDLDRARATLAALPPDLTRAAREPFGARAVALGLLLDDADPTLRRRQLEAVRDPALAAEADRLGHLHAAVPRPDRLALLDLALPALDGLSPEQARTLLEELAALAGADGRITLHEWALQRLVRRRLARILEPPRRAAGARALSQVEVEALDLFSALAWAGSRDPEAAQRALDAGVAALGARTPWRILPRERIDVHRLDAALARLDEATPGVKAQLVAAASACVLADAQVTAAEAELLRAVAGSLGLPMPALSAGAGAPAIHAA